MRTPPPSLVLKSFTSRFLSAFSITRIKKPQQRTASRGSPSPPPFQHAPEDTKLPKKINGAVRDDETQNRGPRDTTHTLVRNEGANKKNGPNSTAEWKNGERFRNILRLRIRVPLNDVFLFSRVPSLDSRSTSLSSGEGPRGQGFLNSRALGTAHRESKTESEYERPRGLGQNENRIKLRPP